MLKCAIFLSCSLRALFANPYSDEVYDAIVDITNPTTEEYLSVDDYIKNGTIPQIGLWVDWMKNPWPRDFTIIKGSASAISRKVTYVNCKKKDPLNNCIVLYASYNKEYPANVESLENIIKKSKYKGHIISRTGGMPNMEAGDLRLCHLPHGYKIAAIREAVRLGYKKVLWLDCTVTPIIDLSIIFDRIAKNKVYAYKTPYALSMLFNGQECLTIYELPVEESNASYCVHRSILGFDLTSSECLSFIENWYSKTINNELYSLTPYDQTSLVSYLLNQSYSPTLFPFALENINSNNPLTLEFTIAGGQ